MGKIFQRNNAGFNCRKIAIMNRKLTYIPNGIMVPEIQVMLSLTQNLIDDKKNKVRIITCGGDKDFACQDWKKAETLGHEDASELFAKNCI